MAASAVRDYLATPDLRLRLVRLPAYSPDFNPDEAIWAWVREEVTANTCFGTKAAVQEKMAHVLRRAAEPHRRGAVPLPPQAAGAGRGPGRPGARVASRRSM